MVLVKNALIKSIVDCVDVPTIGSEEHLRVANMNII